MLVADRFWCLVVDCKPSTSRDGFSRMAQRLSVGSSPSAWPINLGNSMCTLLMRSHAMQTTASERNKGSGQHVFVVSEPICFHLNSPRIT